MSAFKNHVTITVIATAAQGSKGQDCLSAQSQSTASHAPVLLNGAYIVLAQALEANASAPADQQLSDAELVLNSQLLGQLRGDVAAEEARLLSEAPRKSWEQEVQAKRLKAMCWDAFEVRALVCVSWGKHGFDARHCDGGCKSWHKYQPTK